MDLLDRITHVVASLTGEIPASEERTAVDPSARAQALTMKASSEAAVVAGTLSLPPGPLGLITVLPDLLAVWHIQRQLVADIAACYGRTDQLGSETMVYCLFRHAAAQAVRDFVVRVGQRAIVRRASLVTMQRALARVGVSVSRRAAGRTLSRWVPIAGAVGVGAYAFYDTSQVGRTAITLFERDLVVEAVGEAGAMSATDPRLSTGA
jgi:hypothetical protein